MEFWKQVRAWIIPVFAVALAVVLFVFQVTIDFSQLSGPLITINLAFAILISVLSTSILLLLYLVTTAAVQKSGKRILSWITMQTVKKAIIDYNIPVPATGIASVEGSLVIGLDVGSAAGINLGDQFVVYNTTSRETIGVLEVAMLYDDHNVCKIVDMTNLEFWNVLEQRMDYDPSPPAGITITRDTQEEALLQELRSLLESWRG